MSSKIEREKTVIRISLVVRRESSYWFKGSWMIVG